MSIDAVQTDWGNVPLEVALGDPATASTILLAYGDVGLPARLIFDPLLATPEFASMLQLRNVAVVHVEAGPHGGYATSADLAGQVAAVARQWPQHSLLGFVFVIL